MSGRTRRLKSGMSVHKYLSKNKSTGQADFGLGLWHRRSQQTKGSTGRTKAANTLRASRSKEA